MTTRLPAVILIPLLFLHLTGCTVARERALPGGVQDDPERTEVETGNRVTVFLVDGGRVDGEVLAVTPDTLTVGQGGNYGWEETAVAAEQIARIEVVEATWFTKTVLVVTGVGVVVLVLISVAFAASFSGADLS